MARARSARCAPDHVSDGLGSRAALIGGAVLTARAGGESLREQLLRALSALELRAANVFEESCELLIARVLGVGDVVFVSLRALQRVIEHADHTVELIALFEGGLGG